MDRYLEQRQALIETAVPGIDSARRLARITDEAVRELCDGADGIDHAAPWALLALGGYGSGALQPDSDLDLLFVTTGDSSALKPFVQAVLYPLWDAGLKVGHQVRSRKEQLRAVRDDLATLTATLTGRTIAGDEALGADVLRACAADARKRAAAVLRELHARPRTGSPYLLEPDLKEGAGGRRDFDELTWTASVLSGTPRRDPSDLLRLGLLSAEELARLQAAADLTACARWQLARMRGGPLLAEEFARDLDIDLEALQRGLADTHHLLLTVRERTAGRHTPAPMPARERLLGDLLAGRLSQADLERAAWSGGLDEVLPGFGALMWLRRPGLAHTLTVGAHCIASATTVLRVGVADADGAVPGGEIARQSRESIEDLRVPLAAALVHDAGKHTRGPSHAARGEGPAREAALRLGLAPGAAESVARLVRHHLLLAETASHEDLDSEDAVLKAAAVLGERALVAPLHLLTVADSLATGPAAWTSWHDTLLGKLVVRLDAALSPDVDGAGIAQHAEDTRTAALAGLDASGPEADFVRTAPVRYLADRDPAQVLAHARMVSALSARAHDGGHELAIGAGPAEGSYVVTVAARDRHGLFAVVSGALALSGLDILGAQAFTPASGIALDTFVVRSATRADADTGTWARFERTLEAALRDRLALGVRLAERQRHYRQLHREPLTIEPGPQDPYAAVFTVRETDRLGLLYDIARAIAESGLDIVGVTATTKDGRAIDTFRVVDRSGEVPAQGLLGQLAMRLRELG